MEGDLVILRRVGEVVGLLVAEHVGAGGGCVGHQG